MSAGSSHQRFLITGGTGQVGFELARVLAPRGDIVLPGRADLDLANADSIRNVVRAVKPTAIVNAGAYTAVDKAESERELCRLVNTEAPAVLAEEAKRLGVPFVHYSTDYVFDGTSTRPYVETDPTGPLNVYGETKRDGERAIEAVGGAWTVFRTSWVYAARGQNFLRTMLRLARERDELRIVDDQTGAPTASAPLANATLRWLATAWPREACGIYHLTAAGSTTWKQFAERIFALDPRRDEQKVRIVTGIATSEYPTPAKRPRYSVLDCTKLDRVAGIRLADWDEQLRTVIREV